VGLTFDFVLRMRYVQGEATEEVMPL